MLVRDSLVLPPGLCRGSRSSSYGRGHLCQLLGPGKRRHLPKILPCYQFVAGRTREPLADANRRAGRALTSASKRAPHAVTENWAGGPLLLQVPPMSFAEIPAEVDGFGTGEVSLVGPEVLRELLRAADDDGYLSVVLSPPGPGQRGELALVISEAIDGALEQRGACPPGIGAASDLGASLSDQLYRARLVELRGLALSVPTLEGIANLAGALDAEDSAVLRWWMAATRERPVRFYIDARNRYAGIYDRPTPLQDLLDRRPRGAQPPAPALAPEVSASSETMELSSPPPVVALHDELDSDNIGDDDIASDASDASET